MRALASQRSLLWALSCLLSFGLGGCAGGIGGDRQMEAGGVYDGREDIFEVHTWVVRAEDSMDAFLAWAARNPTTVSRSETLSGLVREVSEEKDVWLGDAIAAADEYERALALGDEDAEGAERALRQAMALLRAKMALVARSIVREGGER